MCRIQLRMWRHTPSICASKFPPGQFLKKKNHRVRAYCSGKFFGWQYLQYAYPENHNQYLLFPNMLGTHGFYSIRHQPKNSHTKWPVRWWSWNGIFFFFFQFWRDLNQGHQVHLTCWSPLLTRVFVMTSSWPLRLLWMVKEELLVAAISSATLVLSHFCLLQHPSAISDHTI